LFSSNYLETALAAFPERGNERESGKCVSILGGHAFAKACSPPQQQNSKAATYFVFLAGIWSQFCGGGENYLWSIGLLSQHRGVCIRLYNHSCCFAAHIW
jgi:hypothetical protein